MSLSEAQSINSPYDPNYQKGRKSISPYVSRLSSSNSEYSQPTFLKRMIIQYIELENFKSYAGIVKVGPFHKGFNAIAGANGSGKSNVIDALLFVFGKRAKVLRQKKLSELIHYSQEFPECSNARVSIHFAYINDNLKEPNSCEIIKGSEFEISRTITKSNTSTYYYNNEETSFNEISEKIRANNIDLEYNRFLLLQGEVEQVALMNPKRIKEGDIGLLEYLEEVIGTDKYQEEQEKLQQEVKKHKDFFDEGFSKLTLLDKEVYDLEAPKDKAMLYVKRDQELYTLKNLSLQIDTYFSKQKAKETEEKKKFHENLINELKQKKTTECMKNEEFMRSFKGIMTRKSELRASKEKLIHFIQNDIDKKDKILKNQESKLEVHKDNSIQQLNKWKHKIDELEELTRENSEGIGKKTRIVNELQEELKIAQDHFKELDDEYKEKSSGIQQKILDLKNKNYHQLNQYNFNVSNLEGLNKSIEEMKEKLLESERMYESQKLVIKDFKRTIEEKNEDEETFKRNIGELETELEELKQKFNEIKLEEEKIGEEINGIKVLQNVTKFNIKNLKIKAKLAEIIQKGVREKRLHGIYGRLGDLGEIDSQFDIAVTTAGPLIEGYVVDSVEAGKELIEFAKDKKLGNILIIPLSRIQHNEKRMNSKFQAPNRSKRLFDLIKVKDDKFRIAFYHALKDTLVVNDISTATEIFKSSKGLRIVTLDGKTIESSGVYSGGGMPKSGGMVKISIEQIESEAFKNKLGELPIKNQLLIQCKERKIVIEGNLRSKEEDISKCNANIKKVQEIRKRAELELQNIIDKQENGADVANKEIFKSRIAQNEEEVASAEEKLKELIEWKEDYDKSIQKLETEAKSYESEEHSHLKDDIKRKSETILQLNQEIANLNEDNDANIKTLPNIQKDIENLEKELKEIEEKKNEIKIQKGELEEQGLKVIDDLNKVSEEENNIDKDIKQKEELIKGMRVTISKYDAELKHNYEAIEEIQYGSKAIFEEIGEKTKKTEINRENCNKFWTDYPYIKELEQFTKSNPLPEISHYAKMMNIENGEANNNKREVEDKAETDIRSLDKSVMKFTDGRDVYSNCSEEEIQGLSEKKEEIDNLIKNFEESLRKITVFLPNINDYKVAYEKYVNLNNETNNAKKLLDEANKNFQAIRDKRNKEFMETFSLIAAQVKKNFRYITNGGDADLEPLDPTDPYLDGINYTVRPFKKTWKQLTKLSGGEKTLASLALIFAIHKVKPSPFYCLDELDAALDSRNVHIISKYLKLRSKDTQFLIISLKGSMIENANMIHGVYKIENKSYNIKFDPIGFAIEFKIGIKNSTDNMDSMSGKDDRKEEKQGLKEEESTIKIN